MEGARLKPGNGEEKTMVIRFKLDEGAIRPTKAHELDAGFDLYSREQRRITDCGNSAVFNTGVHVEIPKGYVGYILGRSGLNTNFGVICPTGVVDAGYTGSIKVKLYNSGEFPYTIRQGERIAQLVIQPIADCELVEADTLEDSERGSDGFGSTGR